MSEAATLIPGLNPVMHPANRLQICALLAAVREAEFAVLRESVGISDSVLSKQIKILEDSGYVAVRKATSAARQRTWLALTAAGRTAFAVHVRELERLVALARAGVAAPESVERRPGTD